MRSASLTLAMEEKNEGQEEDAEDRDDKEDGFVDVWKPAIDKVEGEGDVTEVANERGGTAGKGMGG